MNFYHATIAEATEILKRHKQEHYYRFNDSCGCYEREVYDKHLPCDGYVLSGWEVGADAVKFPTYESCEFDHDNPPMTLEQERDYIISLLAREMEARTYADSVGGDYIILTTEEMQAIKPVFDAMRSTKSES